MQIWIFFNAGAGGDRFANLLEHANHVMPLDDQRLWRIHRYVDGEPKFWMPSPDVDQCFRSGKKFNHSTNRLRDSYIRAIKRCTIVPCHDTSLQSLLASDCQEILMKDQIKVLIKSRNISEENLKFAKKNLMELTLDEVNSMYSYGEEFGIFDHEIFLDEITANWKSFNQFLDILQITMAQEFFDHWQQICTGKLVYMTPGIRHYQSSVSNNRLQFQDITELVNVPKECRRFHTFPETE